MRFTYVGLSILALFACGESTLVPGTTGSGVGGSGAGHPGDALPCAVSALLESRCQSCHGASPTFGAPMPLVSRADLLAAPLDGHGTVVERAISRMEGDDGSRMPPPPHEPASASEIAILESWMAAGHPSADGDDCGGGGGGGAGGQPPLDCEPDISLTGAAPFEMPSTSLDEQVCFGVDLPAFEAKRHITAIVPRIDNDKIIHHILLLQADQAVSPEPTPCSFTSSEWKLLYAWGPGTPPHLLPSEAGFPIEAGESVHFVLQVHYNNLNGLEGETDSSGVDLCTTEDLRAHDADIMALGGIFNGNIPPMSTTEADCATPIPSQVGAFFPVTIFQAWPHMHLSGRALESVIEHQGGGSTSIVDVPDYDFEYQLAYPVDLELKVGDTVRTTCRWQNDTAQAKGFGEGTNDEMCFNFVSYYPRIDASFWHWLLPASTASCSMQTQ